MRRARADHACMGVGSFAEYLLRRQVRQDEVVVVALGMVPARMACRVWTRTMVVVAAGRVSMERMVNASVWSSLELWAAAAVVSQW